MHSAHQAKRRRRPAGARRLIAGAVATLVGLGPNAGSAYAQRDAPPSITPAAGQRLELSIEEAQRRARAYPIPTRDAIGSDPTTVPGGDDRQQRVAGRSADQRLLGGTAFAALTAASALFALAFWV